MEIRSKTKRFYSRSHSLLDKVPVLHAFDQDLLKLDGKFPGLTICQPKIKQYEIMFPDSDEKTEKKNKDATSDAEPS
jgi:hypothetical protein